MECSRWRGSTGWVYLDSADLNFSNRPVRTRMPGGVAGARPDGRLLCRFGRRPKSEQKVLPLASGPTSSGALVPSLLQGPAYKGRPWTFTPFAASMRLTPLHNDSTRPPEWGGWRRLWNWGLKARHVASAVRLRFDKHKRVAVMAASGVFNHQGGQGARCPSWLSINACRFG